MIRPCWNPRVCPWFLWWTASQFLQITAASPPEGKTQGEGLYLACADRQAGRLEQCRRGWGSPQGFPEELITQTQGLSFQLHEHCLRMFELWLKPPKFHSDEDVQIQAHLRRRDLGACMLADQLDSVLLALIALVTGFTRTRTQC